MSPLNGDKKTVDSEELRLLDVFKSHKPEHQLCSHTPAAEWPAGAEQTDFPILTLITMVTLQFKMVSIALVHKTSENLKRFHLFSYLYSDQKYKTFFFNRFNLLWCKEKVSKVVI